MLLSDDLEKKMHLPLAAQSASTAVVPQPPEITFRSAGSTFQRSAFSIFKQSFGPVSYAGDEVAEYGPIYQPYRSTRGVIDGSISLSGGSALARAKNLTVLSRKLAGGSANNRLSEVSSELLAAVNQRNASNESQKIGSRLIGMQFQLAGLSTTYRGNRPVDPLGPRIDDRGCFEHIGDRPALATLRAGIYGRPAVLAKRVQFLEACQSKAQRYLADQIRDCGQSSELFSGEDLVHRARLTLIAAPTDTLRQKYKLATEILKEIEELDDHAQLAFQRVYQAPTSTRINSILVESKEFQNTCRNLRSLLIEFGNPIP